MQPGKEMPIAHLFSLPWATWEEGNTSTTATTTATEEISVKVCMGTTEEWRHRRREGRREAHVELCCDSDASPSEPGCTQHHTPWWWEDNFSFLLFFLSYHDIAWFQYCLAIQHWINKHSLDNVSDSVDLIFHVFSHHLNYLFMHFIIKHRY